MCSFEECAYDVWPQKLSVHTHTHTRAHTPAYYKAHGIRFAFKEAKEQQVEATLAAAAREKIWSIKRSNDNKTNNDIRNEVFMTDVIPQYNTKTMTDMYNIYLFDYIGEQFQGFTLMKTHTVVMGVRSDKGYPTPTRRPDERLAKTCGHELGHALGLGHPRQKFHPNGVSQLYDETLGRDNPDNLMCGGKEKNGGGGSGLLPWQVEIVRMEACKFLGVENAWCLILKCSQLGGKWARIYVIIISCVQIDHNTNNIEAYMFEGKWNKVQNNHLKKQQNVLDPSHPQSL